MGLFTPDIGIFSGDSGGFPFSDLFRSGSTRAEKAGAATAISADVRGLRELLERLLESFDFGQGFAFEGLQAKGQELLNTPQAEDPFLRNKELANRLAREQVTQSQQGIGRRLGAAGLGGSGLAFSLPNQAGADIQGKMLSDALARSFQERIAQENLRLQQQTLGGQFIQSAAAPQLTLADILSRFVSSLVGPSLGAQAGVEGQRISGQAQIFSDIISGLTGGG